MFEFFEDLKEFCHHRLTIFGGDTFTATLFPRRSSNFSACHRERNFAHLIVVISITIAHYDTNWLVVLPFNYCFYRVFFFFFSQHSLIALVSPERINHGISDKYI